MTNFSSQRRALVVQNDFSPFGNKLIQSGYVNRDQMQQALVESRKTGKPLTQIIEALTGQALPPDLIRQYKKQQLFELKILYGVESMDPELDERPIDEVGELIDTLIPIDICRRHQLIPLSRQEVQPPALLVAMVHPDNLDAQDDLNRILRPQGLALNRLVIAQEDYERMIDRYLNRQLERERLEASEQAVNIVQDLAGLEDLGFGDAPDDVDDDLGAALKDAEGAPIISLANKIMIKALTDGASDIHVEPQEEMLRVRFRKDGVLHQAFEPFPKKITPAITSRFKIMANLDIAERRSPQDGRIRRQFQGKTVDFRVNTLPSRYGEKICMRVLNNESTQLGLDKLITDEETLAMVRDMANKPFGLLLVTGPTGSGKSTTLYSCLAERNSPGININTAEDPIEYSLPGITQVQVIREKGMNFSSILRAFMRQDPDVILVGETRDLETAKTAIEAALTGHLVLTTLHANDAPSSVARLDEMGVEPFMVAASLLGVCSQRLVRRVCQTCRIPFTPTPEQLARFGLSASGELDLTFYRANELSNDQLASAKEQGKLCETCKGAGYKGRVGVYEVMRVNEELQAAINKGATIDRIKELAVEGGMKTLLSYSLQLVQEGLTTLEEVERVTFTDSGLEAELKAKRKTSLTCNTCGAGLQQEWLDCPYCLTPRFSA
ncbi:MAG: type II/IV secretion system protein [Synechococcales cyanobacterium RM1_1_8]|nr:type II/IV secretion system protein [Synechococcales cyanobacterium RM1_1_8]